ncbi:hypothetical protein CTRI78_v004006 [Colletotrichum trifolii]|uniref:Uncharacterized protein n=1 Tax=Colletotrichum trifolii TaxID=5466 RepID=A0A4R8RI61_COLTR|nr:hypothetical protein CTRI78_v004006 [Colletotrichum trifolii]
MDLVDDTFLRANLAGEELREYHYTPTLILIISVNTMPHDSEDSTRPMLTEDEKEEGCPLFPSPELQRRYQRELLSKLLVGLVLSIIFAFSVTWALQSIVSPSHASSTREIMKSPCGNSSSDARARGCHFDVLSFCWVPDECFDRELTDKFRKAGPWVFYTDMNKTASITEEQFGSNTQHVYLTNRLHKAHCAYNMLRFHKALTENRMVHREDVLTHTQHCTQVLTRIDEPEDILVRAKIQYPDCGHFSAAFPGKAKEGVPGHKHGHSHMGRD